MVELVGVIVVIVLVVVVVVMIMIVAVVIMVMGVVHTAVTNARSRSGGSSSSACRLYFLLTNRPCDLQLLEGLTSISNIVSISIETKNKASVHYWNEVKTALL